MADLQKVKDDLLLIQVQSRCIQCALKIFPIPLSHESNCFYLNQCVGNEKRTVVTLSLNSSQSPSHFIEEVKVFQFGLPVIEMTGSDARWSATLDMQSGYCISCAITRSVHPNYQLIIYTKMTLIKADAVFDVEFQVRGVKMAANSQILADASPFLSARVEQIRQENESENVRIDDTRPEVFQQLLTYLHTGKVPALNEEGMAVSLFIASDKFAVNSLKEECIAYLADRLSEKTLNRKRIHK